MSRVRATWWRVSSSLWFVPAVMVVGAIAIATALVEVDARLAADLARSWPRLFGAGAEGARGILSAIATSMMTVAGVVFSVTLVALSLAASQYSPRVLRTFMADRPTQVVLGVFVSVFAYCLVVLRTIRAGEPESFVPSLAVLGGMALALTAIGFLVFFIHHLATSIEASSILTQITKGTLVAVNNLFPEELGEAEEDTAEAEREVARIREWVPIASLQTGYLISVDSDGLLAFAQKRGRIVRMERAIGEFVVESEPLAWLSGAEVPDLEARDALNALYAVDRERTLQQDAGFGIQQIVDMGLKALSPGINDQTTAITCIDRLTEILVVLARRRIGTSYRRDNHGVKVMAAGPTFSGLVALSLDDMRANAAGKRTVLMRLLWAIERTGAAAREAKRKHVLAAHALAIAETAERTVQADEDRLAVVTAAQRLHRILITSPTRSATAGITAE